MLVALSGIQGGNFYFTDPILDSKDFLTEQTVNDASQVNQTGHGGVIHLSSI